MSSHEYRLVSRGQLKVLFSAIIGWSLLVPSVFAADSSEFAVELPDGVRAVWNLDSASRQTTSTRERICVNGLWRWRPAEREPTAPPSSQWGYFKVPGCWPGITDYMQKDCQTVFAHPGWQDARLSNLSTAWYEREVSVPANWSGRKVALSIEYLNSWAVVYVDGQRVGELRFPGGSLDLTPHVVPGQTHRLSLHVSALPLQGVMLSYSDSNAAREVQGRVERRGLCGDVYLESYPEAERISWAKVDTSFRTSEIRFEAALEQMKAEEHYVLQSRVMRAGETLREFVSGPFRGRDVREGRFAFDAKWLPEELWDIHTPENMCEVTLTLRTAADDAERNRDSELGDANVLDTSFPERFGFREFWIEGRDFYLNGSRIFLSAVPLDNAQVGAAWAGYEGARESFRRLKSFGVNFVYTHNYDCQPGSHLSFREILRAADDEGVLVALTQPHFSHYDWQADDADMTNGYARHAEFYVRAAQNHPSVIAYSMSHNACGYGEDMNPDMIDGIRDPRSSGYERRNADRALRAEAIVKRLDPARIVYHHAGGNLGAMHTVNFYPNFVPVQEMSDWFEHWSTMGVKPAFPCEYAAPFLWDWGMYRGWYQGEREFGSARVPWDFSLAEWNSQFLGDRAFQVGDFEKANVRWEAEQFREGRQWHRWDYPFPLGSNVFENRYPILTRYLTDNWRAFRTWELSAFSPWEHGEYWRLRAGVNRDRQDIPVDWQTLQRPGFSADYLDQRYERMDLAYDADDWEPLPPAQALLRNNMPVLGYIAGKPQQFTSKDHLFTPGESVEKQLIVINNSRRTIECECAWSMDLPVAVSGRQQVTVATGKQVRIPLSIPLPSSTKVGEYQLRARFEFSNGTSHDDSFAIHVISAGRMMVDPSEAEQRLAVYDPQGETSEMLRRAGVEFQTVGADADLQGIDQLIVGKAALAVDGPAPDIARVRSGLRVILFEQTAEVLEKRLGFRVAEYGLREVFPRVPDHPLLTGLGTEQLRDWRGSATLLDPRLTYELRPRLGPTVRWCGLEVPRLWRCGNRGNVASVLIEKPARGDFKPIVDGGYSLQYSPLMVYEEGQGMILFCQLDVTARTESDPAARTLVANLLEFASSWQPHAPRLPVYVGEQAGKRHLESAGFELQPYIGKLTDRNVLVVGPGSEQRLAADADAIRAWLQVDGRLLALGLDQSEAHLLLSEVGIQPAEHIAAYFEPAQSGSPFCGVGPSDVYCRDPRRVPLISSGADAMGNGALATAENATVAFCQVAPWQLDNTQTWNVKKTYRRWSFLVTRVLANLGAASQTPIIERFHTPVQESSAESSESTGETEDPRWRAGLYLDQPEEWDDPYRFFRW